MDASTSKGNEQAASDEPRAGVRRYWVSIDPFSRNLDIRTADEETRAWHLANRVVVEGVLVYEVRHVIAKMPPLPRTCPPHDAAARLASVLLEAFADQIFDVRAAMPKKKAKKR